MGASQRRKGATGERELAALLTESLGVAVKRNLGQARDSGDDITVGKFRIECKRHNALRIMEWVRQIEHVAGPGEVPIVAFRQDGQEWRCVIRLEDLLPLIRGEL